MKNFLILGLLALLLFAVSASLSLWLNQSKPTDTAAEKSKDDKVGAKTPKNDNPKESVEPRPPAPKAEGLPGGPEATAVALREQQDKLTRRATQLDIVVRDLQTQREATEATLRQVMSELKNVSTETTKLDALAEELKKKKVEFEAGEKKNIEKIAALYDAMAPEEAAPIIKQMADTGRLDTAAKILAQMKDRKAAPVLAAMNDSALAAQILERIRLLRVATPPTPGAAVIPAKGP